VTFLIAVVVVVVGEENTITHPLHLEPLLLWQALVGILDGGRSREKESIALV